jgi:hypothetical protein
LDNGHVDTMPFGQIENILARVFEVEPTGKKILGARLKHLRIIGVPEVPRPGSGQRLLYTKDMALEMLFATGWENLGQTPRIAAKLTKELSSHSQLERIRKVHAKGEQLFAILVPGGDGSVKQLTLATGEDGTDALPLFSAMCLTALMAKFEQEWAEERKGGSR